MSLVSLLPGSTRVEQFLPAREEQPLFMSSSGGGSVGISTFASSTPLAQLGEEEGAGGALNFVLS